MKKICTLLLSVLSMALACHYVLAQEVTITLKHGWTWISYPRADTLDVNTALQSIPPMEGDVIKSQNSMASYINGEWVGSLQRLVPGKGLVYKSQNPSEVTFVFGSATSVPTGAIKGAFTINENGDQVYFSQGNLQYIGSANTPYWKFADHQWDYIGGAQSGDSENLDRDLFGWGTSGYDHGATCYHPWSTNTNAESYFAYGNSIYNLYEKTGKADWGYNAICNGGNHENIGWRTLTPDEWTYIFSTRSTASGIRWAQGCVNNVNGVILLPDNWDVTTYELNDVNGGSYNSNTISLKVWTALFEADGAVFLPASGHRVGTSASNENDYGVYWSSVCDGSYARNIMFQSGNMNLSDNYYRFYGRSVRLVHSVDNTSYSIEAEPNPVGSGVVTGTRPYVYGSICALTASPLEGYDFLNWTEDGEVLSQETTYCFTVTGQRNLVANFVAKATPVLTDGLMAYYPFDGNADDASGNEYHATPYNNYQYEGGTFGGSISVLGEGSNGNSGGHVILPEYDFDISSGITVSLWVKAYGLMNTDGETYISFGNDIGSNSEAERLFIMQMPDAIRFVYHESEISVPYENSYIGTWVLYTLTCNSNGKLTGYINGNKVGEETVNYTNQWNTSLAALGRHWWNSGSETSTRFIGSFDDVRIYNRALTPREVQTLYSGQGGWLSGVFSVSDSDKVNFSQGNLQYIGSAATPYWKFADNQWDYFGEDQNGDVYNIDRDLFGWGTSGYDHGAVCYQPWSTDQNDGRYSAYGGDYYNLYDQSGKADWGYNPISNGGNSVNQWRTMSANEWGYIFNTRNTESGVRFAKAVVNGVNGVVLLPDNWRTSNYVLNNTNDRGANYDNNNISAADWKNILEAQGAVFLPAAGDRWGTSVVEAGTGGFYWSSSCKGGSQACDISFRSNEMCLDGYCGYYRHCGRSVRLVRSAGDMSYYIDAASNPDEGGTVTGAGTYDEGSTCILMAIANEGYTFINWTENGVEVSTQATYSFTVTSNRNLVANFVPNSGVPIGAVNGRFTINEEGDQVYFSQGNLQYTKSTQTWSFMEHQYDVIVTEGQDVGDDYANTDIVSHFCWGTSGYNLRGTETDYYYQPFNTYQESGDAYGPSGSHNLTGDYANGDWGVYNAISNGGNVDNYWRTLTRDEWYYLFTGRDDALSKWERGNIDGVNGVILLPDDWELPEGLTFNVIDESDYEANTYTLQQWETMQAAGAVFLPASGWRRGTEVSEVNNLVGYWSSTYEYGFSAHNIWIENYGSSSHTVFNDRSYRYRGYAVRLVRDAGIVSYSIDAAPSPTEGGTVTGTGTFNEGASCTLTAMPNEGYTFVNWTENGVEVSTQATYSFTVTSNRTLAANFTYNGGGASHEYVDLGLPSGTLWATCNVGADTPEGYGDYFAWGEIQPKNTYNWDTYQYYNGSFPTKYTGSDGLTTLQPGDDAATTTWGNGWRMPTKEEWEELFNNTTDTWTTRNGVNGRLFTANNGNSIFLPAAGSRDGGELSLVGDYGIYWSSSLCTSESTSAWNPFFHGGWCSMNGCNRYYGLSVRAVRGSQD